jgi:hypothetical protein
MDVTTLLSGAGLCIMGFVAAQVWDLKTSVAKIAQKLDDHLTAHDKGMV